MHFFIQQNNKATGTKSILKATCATLLSPCQTASFLSSEPPHRKRGSRIQFDFWPSGPNLTDVPFRLCPRHLPQRIRLSQTWSSMFCLDQPQEVTLLTKYIFINSFFCSSQLPLCPGAGEQWVWKYKPSHVLREQIKAAGRSQFLSSISGN